MRQGNLQSNLMHCLTTLSPLHDEICRLLSRCVRSAHRTYLEVYSDKNKACLQERKKKFVSSAHSHLKLPICQTPWRVFTFVALGCIIWLFGATQEERSLVLKSVISTKSKKGEVTWYEWGPDRKRERKRWSRESEKAHKVCFFKHKRVRK